MDIADRSGLAAQVPLVVYESAPLSMVRWIEVEGASDAIAVVGTADGGPDADCLSTYAVRLSGNVVEAERVNAISHNGRVTDIVPWSERRTLLTASSDGHVRGIPYEALGDSLETLRPVCTLPKTARGRESVMGVAALPNDHIVAVGSGGTLQVADVETGEVLTSVQSADAIGFRSCNAEFGQGSCEFVTVGGSGVCAVWDERTFGSSREPVSQLRHPNPTASPVRAAVDHGKSHFVLAGTTIGEVAIWDRRSGESSPINRISIHDGFIWDVRVLVNPGPGLLLSCGEDGSVWLMDFGAASARHPFGTASAVEPWRAELTEGDVRNISSSVGKTLGVNSVDAHPEADLIAYASDSAVVSFGSLYKT